MLIPGRRNVMKRISASTHMAVGITFLTSPTTMLVGFVAVGGFLAYYFYMRRMLRHLDPSSVIPDRVKTMLNTLAEGVLILDKQERIVLANEAFAAIVGRNCNELQGQ